MKIIVMKFGGTSVADESGRVAMLEHVIREVEAGFKVVVVVSAMGRLGSPYATDTLSQLVSSTVLPKESDRLLSCGEVISSIVTSDLARRKGLSVTSLAPIEIGIITDGNYTDANILRMDTAHLLEKFKAYDVLIAPGFMGVSREGFITTLGRGGSDTSAVALGASLNADHVDVYSDVPGVMTADPKVDPNAVLIPEMNYDALIEIAEAGARVIHLKAVKLAKAHRVSLRLRSTFEEGVGTTVGV